LNLQAETPEELSSGSDLDAAFSGAWWADLSIAIFCTLFAGVMSGLTIGLASIDRLLLEIDSRSDPEAGRMSKRIFPVIDKHHWMLVTLLLCNATAMETLPLFLDKMVPEVYAIIISVSAVLFVGEIIPQAICTGPSQLKIAYYMCPIVTILMWGTCPISWPIAKVLDYLMGEHEIQRFNSD
jgi:metal transporter CNNM